MEEDLTTVVIYKVEALARDSQKMAIKVNVWHNKNLKIDELWMMMMVKQIFHYYLILSECRDNLQLWTERL